MEDQSSDYTDPQGDENTAHGSKLLAIIKKLKPKQDGTAKDVNIEADEKETKKANNTNHEPKTDNEVVQNGDNVILIDDSSDSDAETKKKRDISHSTEEEPCTVVILDDATNGVSEDIICNGAVSETPDTAKDGNDDSVTKDSAPSETTDKDKSDDSKKAVISVTDDEEIETPDVEAVETGAVESMETDNNEEVETVAVERMETDDVEKVETADVEQMPVVILPENLDNTLATELTGEGKDENAIKDEMEPLGGEDEDDDGQFALEELLPEIVTCTACGKKINPLKKGVCQHPELGVLVCKSCSRFYNSSPFNRDSNGMEEHCKWCAEGGTLVMCDFCEKVFCEQCIKRNLGKEFYTMLLDADDSLKWQCFACDKSQLEQLQMQCNLIIKTLDQLKMKGVLTNRKKINTSGSVDAAERKARLASLSEALGSPDAKEKTFRLDSPDIKEHVKTGQKSVTEKVRKKKIRIVESDEDSSGSNAEKSVDESDEEANSSDERGKNKKGRGKTTSAQQSDNKRGGVSKKKPSNMKKDGSSEEESYRHTRTPLKVRFGFRKSRMKTRQKGKLLTDISDPGLGTSKSYANEDYFSSDSVGDDDKGRQIKTVPLKNITDFNLQDFVIPLKQMEPSEVDKAVRIEEPTTDVSSGADNEATAEVSTSSKKGSSHTHDKSQGESATLIKEQGKKRPMGKRTHKFLSKKQSSESEKDSEDSTTKEEVSKSNRDVQNKRKVPTGKRTKKFIGKKKQESENEEEEVKEEVAEAEMSEGEEEMSEDTQKQGSKDIGEKNKKKRKDKKQEVIEIDASDDDDGIDVPEEVKGTKSDEDTDEDNSNDESDSKPQKKGKGRKIVSSQSSSSSSDSEYEEEDIERRLRSRKRLASSDSSSSGSATNVKTSSKRKSRITNTRKRRRSRKESSDEKSEDKDSDDSGPSKKRKKRKPARKKRKGRKGKKGKKKSGSSDDSESEKESPSKKGRKNIRRILKDEELTEQTKHARQLEEERRKRLLARTETKTGEESDGAEEEEDGALVLERDKDGKAIVSVASQVASYLKPHQREGVKFMYDCVVESVKKWDENEYEGGCLLAHCMGLGKTLQVVALVHTLINSEKISLGRVLVVAPLNTVLNWQVEFEKWLNVDDRLEVYVLHEAGANKWSRTNMLSDWNMYGGILVMGYDMYRNLSQLLRIRSKKQKEIIKKSLIDPGPELVICDEGHILRNDQSAISKQLNNIKTKRRIVLTGTPLQNNLIEYHCMVNFVKPNLLGLRKEFTNRFVNPILNGQLSNSTPADVRLMKQRCHILHELLSGCVLRRDYSVLTPFLSPKHEYTIFVRLSEKQRKMYQYFLDTFICKDLAEVKSRGVSLFSDYQCLMRIWTHPWAVKLEALRRLEREKYADDMEDFLNDESEGSNETEDGHNSDYKKGSDSSDFETTRGKKKKEAKKSESEESEEEEEEEEEDEEEEEEEEKSSEEEEVQVRTVTRRTRASAAAAEKSKSANKQSKTDRAGHVRPSFISPGKKKGKSRVIESDDDDEEPILVVEPSAEPSHKTTRSGSSFKVTDNDADFEPEPEWYDQFLTQEDEHDIEISGKLVILMELLTDAELVGDKVLVFSQSLVSLDLIEKCLGNGTIGGDSVNWCRGVDYFRMDGSTAAQTRQRYAEIFNDVESSCRLFLISTRAGSLGINLIAANRVVIFDCSWNPSHDVQSIFRVYRFGQTKHVFVYRLVAQGTMEEKIYNRQITKMAIAGRVVDEQQIERHFTDEEIRELYVFQPDTYNEGDQIETPQLPKDALLAEVLQRQHPKWIVRYHEHDLLLENIEDEKLSEEERKQAWAQYEEEKNSNAQYLARMQMEQERMKEFAKLQEKQREGASAQIRFPISSLRAAQDVIDGTRITQAQAEALFRQLQQSRVPGQNLDRAQIFRQYTDANGRTITKMQIPSGTSIRMMQPPQDRNLYPAGSQPYRIEGHAPNQRPRFQIPPPYSTRPPVYNPRTTASMVMYRPRNLAPTVSSLLGFNPYQPRPFNYQARGQSFRLPNTQGR